MNLSESSPSLHHHNNEKKEGGGEDTVDAQLEASRIPTSLKALLHSADMQQDHRFWPHRKTGPRRDKPTHSDTKANHFAESCRRQSGRKFLDDLSCHASCDPSPYKLLKVEVVSFENVSLNNGYTTETGSRNIQGKNGTKMLRGPLQFVRRSCSAKQKCKAH